MGLGTPCHRPVGECRTLKGQSHDLYGIAHARRHGDVLTPAFAPSN